MPDAATLTELGASLCRVRHIGDAEAALLEARRLSPQPAARLHAKLAIVRLIQGRADEAMQLLRMAMASEPDSAALHSKLIAIFAYHPQSDTRTIKAEQRAWDRRHSPASAPHTGATRSPHAKLRIGYVARDFGSHSVTRVCGAAITHADRDRFAIYCYSGSSSWDAGSLALCFCVDGWRTTAGLDDAALEARIRSDAIDVLVDLDGHMDHNRLPVFGRRPAPVQLSGWGYLPGPGVSAISGLLTDSVVTPLGERSLIPETCFDLPCAHWYQVPELAVEPGPPPSRSRGVLTFGSFNRVEKIGPDVCEAWAAILRVVHGSRLVLMDAAFEDSHMRQVIHGRFADAGVDSQRIELRPRCSFADYLAAYRDVDVALDPWPHGGGLTTLDALWMGVPVITWSGTHALGRTSASILTCLDCKDLIAADVPSYVDAAVSLARTPERLVLWRGDLRGRIGRSALGNAAAYARAVEDAYRRAWEAQ